MSADNLISLLATRIYPALLVVFFFGLTIFIHELGHFLVAKWQGMKVERFSVGFGPKIFGWTGKDGVDYRISWIPFGGYVALPQMSPMEAIEGKTEAQAHELPPASPWAKIQVAFAGPIMNIILGLVLATILWQVGKPMNPSIVGWVEAGSSEDQAGIKTGDHVVAVNDQEVKTWTQVMQAVAFAREPQVRLMVERGGQRTAYTIEPKVNEEFGVKQLDLYPRERPFARAIEAGRPAERAGLQPGDRFVSVQGVPVYSAEQLAKELIGKRANQATEIKVLRRGKALTLTVTPEYLNGETSARMGVALGDDLEVVRPGPTPLEQFQEVFDSMAQMAAALFYSKETGVGVQSVSGPVGILGAWWYAIVSGGILQGIVIAVMLNINLAVLNLLPLPILDGGHIVFALLEAVRRKPLNARLVQNVSIAFAVLLISFMLYVSWNDLQHYIPKSRATPVPTETPAPPRP